jgi:hypothetical protein
MKDVPWFPTSLILWLEKIAQLPTLWWSTYATNGIKPQLSSGVRRFDTAADILDSERRDTMELNTDLRRLQTTYESTNSEYQKITESVRPQIEFIQNYSRSLEAMYIKYPGGRDELYKSLVQGFNEGKIIWDNGTDMPRTSDPAYTQVINSYREILIFANKNLDALVKAYNEIEASGANYKLFELQKRIDDIKRDIIDYQRYIASQQKYLDRAQASSDKAFQDRFLQSFWWNEKKKVYNDLFEKIFRQKYSDEKLQSTYEDAANAYGRLLYGLNTNEIKTTDIQKNLLEYGKSLSKESQILFLNLLGEELGRRTYNYDVLNRKIRGQTVWLEQQLGNLSVATFSGQESPMSVCVGIHASIAQVAKLWDIDAGVVSVWGKTGHAISLFRIGNTTMLSDYGKAYIGSNTEQALDTYSLANKHLTFIHYLMDPSGKIIWQIRTPLSDGFEKALFHTRSVQDYILNPSKIPEWVSLELTNLTKGVTLTKHISHNWYTRLGYKETDLYGLKIQTASATVWYEKQGEFFKWFLEAGFSKSSVTFTNKTTSWYTWAHIAGGIVWNSISPISWLKISPYTTMKLWAQFWNGTWDGSDVGRLWSAIAGKADIDVGIIWKTASTSFDIGARRTFTPREMQAPLTSGLGWYTTLHAKLGIQGNLWSTHLYGSTFIEKDPISQRVWINWGFRRDEWSGDISLEKQVWKNTLGPSDIIKVQTRVAYALSKNSQLFAKYSSQTIWGLPPIKQPTIGLEWGF